MSLQGGISPSFQMGDKCCREKALLHLGGGGGGRRRGGWVNDKSMELVKVE